MSKCTHLQYPHQNILTGTSFGAPSFRLKRGLLSPDISFFPWVDWPRKKTVAKRWPTGTTAWLRRLGIKMKLEWSLKTWRGHYYPLLKSWHKCFKIRLWHYQNAWLFFDSHVWTKWKRRNSMNNMIPQGSRRGNPSVGKSFQERKRLAQVELLSTVMARKPSWDKPL